MIFFTAPGSSRVPPLGGFIFLFANLFFPLLLLGASLNTSLPYSGHRVSSLQPCLRVECPYCVLCTMLCTCAGSCRYLVRVTWGAEKCTPQPPKNGTLGSHTRLQRGVTEAIKEAGADVGVHTPLA